MAEVQRQRDGSFLRNPFGIFPAVALRLCALASLR